MSTTIKQRFIHMAPRKLRLVADLIRGKSTDSVLQILHVMPKASARQMKTIVTSAIASAKQQNNDGPYKISTVFVDEGPALKRRILLSKGRSSRMEHRMSHVTLTIEPAEVKATNSKKRSEK